MARKYFTLVVLRDGIWQPEFGDYEKEVVEDEKSEYKGKKKIIKTDDNQTAINSAIAKLNEVK